MVSRLQCMSNARYYLVLQSKPLNTIRGEACKVFASVPLFHSKRDSVTRRARIMEVEGHTWRTPECSDGLCQHKTRWPQSQDSMRELVTSTRPSPDERHHCASIRIEHRFCCTGVKLPTEKYSRTTSAPNLYIVLISRETVAGDGSLAPGHSISTSWM